VSIEAVKWAMDDAPMLRTSAGKADTTARHVLQALAEHASKTGTNTHPSEIRIQYRTGYDRRTVQRALRRLEDAKLIIPDGTVQDRNRYRLAMNITRNPSDWDELEREEQDSRAAAAERKRRSRARRVTHSNDVTVTDTKSVTEPDVTHSESGRHALEMRDVTHFKSGRHALSAAVTTNEPPVEPPTTSMAGVGPSTYSPQGLAPSAPIDDAGFAVTDSMRRWAKRDGYSDVIDIEHSTEQFLSHYRSTGVNRHSWPDAWQKWIREDAKRASQRRATGNVVQLASGQILTGTDARVAAHSALTEQLRALENRETS
jgi:hypothetical protein